MNAIQRKIIHIDMDSFYAAVEVKYNPELKGKKLAVGGSPQDRSVICTASYEARPYGVRAGISSYKALKLCPDLILIPPDFSKYSAESEAIHEIFRRFTDKIEPLSLDEAYLDVTGSEFFKGSATLIAKEIRRLIKEERGLTASAGIASNKFLAKVASDWKKPDGQFTVTPKMIDEFVYKLPVENIFGVGRVTASKMHELGFKTCGDLQKCSIQKLEELFGNSAQYLYEMSRGIDDREVQTEWKRKSLSVEFTYPKDLANIEECLLKIPELYEEFVNRYNNKDDEALIPKGFFVKLKFSDFKSTTVERQLETPFIPPMEEYIPLFKTGHLRRNKPVRLLGLGVKFFD